VAFSFQKSKDRFLQTGVLPGKRALCQWRKIAREQALEGGARWSCQICKRPIGTAATTMEKATGTYGTIVLRVPGAWRSTPINRKICYSCYAYFLRMIQEAEFLFIEDHLPPEIIEEQDE